MNGNVLLPGYGRSTLKDKTMYLDELSHEAKLIVQGRQAYVAQFNRFIARCRAWLFS
jgi:hypothetical protein